MKSRYPGRHTLTLLGMACLTPAVTAASSVEVGASWLYFDYQEENASGQVLNEESGDIPGVYLAWEPSLGEHWWGRLEAGYSKHQVDYDGQTQAGAPLSTSTDQRLIHYDGRLGPQLSYRGLDIRPYLAARYQRWDRAIQPTTFTRGLNEHYRWWEAGAGVQGCLTGQRWASQVCLDLAGFKTLDGEVEVAIGNARDDYPVLHQGDGDGYRIQLRWSPPATSAWVFTLYHAAWSFEESDAQLIRIGFASFLIREPESETRQSGVRVALRF